MQFHILNRLILFKESLRSKNINDFAMKGFIYKFSIVLKLKSFINNHFEKFLIKS